MTIDVRQENGICVVTLTGEVKSGAPTEALRSKSRDLVQGGQRFFVLDMGEVSWLDSSGIGEVIACYKRAREKQGVVKLVLRDRSYSLFTMTQLDRIFEIFPDIDNALASFAAEGSDYDASASGPLAARSASRAANPEP